jgi:hypothetical protein
MVTHESDRNYAKQKDYLRVNYVRGPGLAKQRYDKSQVHAAFQAKRQWEILQAPKLHEEYQFKLGCVVVMQRLSKIFLKHKARKSAAVLTMQCWIRKLRAVDVLEELKYFQHLEEQKVVDELERRRLKREIAGVWLHQRAVRAVAFMDRKDEDLAWLMQVGTETTVALENLQRCSRGSLVRMYLRKNEAKREQAKRGLLHRVTLVRSLHDRQGEALDWLAKRGRAARAQCRAMAFAILREERRAIGATKARAATIVQKVVRGRQDRALVLEKKTQLLARAEETVQWLKARAERALHHCGQQIIARKYLTMIAAEELVKPFAPRWKEIFVELHVVGVNPHVRWNKLSRKQRQKHLQMLAEVRLAKHPPVPRAPSPPVYVAAAPATAPAPAKAPPPAAAAPTPAATRPNTPAPAPASVTRKTSAAPTTVPPRKASAPASTPPRKASAAPDTAPPRKASATVVVPTVAAQPAVSTTTAVADSPSKLREEMLVLQAELGALGKGAEGRPRRQAIRKRGKQIQELLTNMGQGGAATGAEASAGEGADENAKREAEELADRKLEAKIKRKIKKIFDQMDLDDSGAITKEEMKEFYSRSGADTTDELVQAQMDEQWDKVDVNTDGKVTLLEFETVQMPVIKRQAKAGQARREAKAQKAQ